MKLQVRGGLDVCEGHSQSSLILGMVAGIELGDIILGIDYKACRAKTTTLANEVARAISDGKQSIEIQAMRFTDVNSKPTPGCTLSEVSVSCGLGPMKLSRLPGCVWRDNNLASRKIRFQGAPITARLCLIGRSGLEIFG